MSMRKICEIFNKKKKKRRKVGKKEVFWSFMDEILNKKKDEKYCTLFLMGNPFCVCVCAFVCSNNNKITMAGVTKIRIKY